MIGAALPLSIPVLAIPILAGDGDPFHIPLGHFPWWIAIALMMIGFHAVIRKGNLIKKLIGAGVFQTAVFLFYLSIGKIIDPASPYGATAPILFPEGTTPPHLVGVPFENPVPHVLMLTGIVVGVATTAVGLALTVRIHRAFGTIEEDELISMTE